MQEKLPASLVDEQAKCQVGEQNGSGDGDAESFKQPAGVDVWQGSGYGGSVGGALWGWGGHRGVLTEGSIGGI